MSTWDSAKSLDEETVSCWRGPTVREMSIFFITFPTILVILLHARFNRDGFLVHPPNLPARLESMRSDRDGGRVALFVWPTAMAAEGALGRRNILTDIIIVGGRIWLCDLGAVVVSRRNAARGAVQCPEWCPCSLLYRKDPKAQFPIIDLRPIRLPPVHLV